MHTRHAVTLVFILAIIAGCAPAETVVVPPYEEPPPPPRAEAVRPAPAPAPPRAEYGYAQETAGVTVVSVTAEPSVVRAGDSLEIVLDYLVYSSGNRAADVMETLEVRYGGVLVSMPTYKWNVRPGRHEARVNMTVPPGAESGTYDVTALVSTEDGDDVGEGYFRVL